MHLFRVCLEIIKFPIVIHVEVHQLVAFHLHTVMGTHAVEAGKLIIVIVQGLTPVARCLAFFHQFLERNALHVLRNGDAAHIKESRSKVDVLGQTCNLRTRFDMSRPAHHHRHTKRLFVHETLVKPAMFAQVEALIGGIDYNRILVQPRTFEIVQYLAHTLVHTCYTSHVVLQVTLVFPFSHFLK